MKPTTILAVAAAFFSPSLALHVPAAHSHSQSLQTEAHFKKNISNYPSYTFEELYNLTTRFFDNFAYPNDAVQARKINSTLFAKDVLGRIDVTRNFDGQELNTEYAFGLFANLALNPDSFTLLGIPVKYTITHFAANAYIVSVALIVEFEITALGVTNPVEVSFAHSPARLHLKALTDHIQIDFWCTFNGRGQIDQYDATFRYLQWQFDYLMSVGEQVLQVNSTAEVQSIIQAKLAQSICNTAQTYCNGTNQQYESEETCYEFLNEQVPFGQAYEMGMNTVLCRMVHQNMVPLRPDVHCSHIGPTGGAYCVNDRTYSGTVLQPFFTNKPFVPYGFHNKNNTLAAQ